MAWERRGGRQYYYRTVRENGRVGKVYVGTGPLARRAAHEDERRQREKDRRRARRQSLLARLLEAEALADTEREAFTRRAEQMLDEAGYHYHRGSWRRRRAGAHGR